MLSSEQCTDQKKTDQSLAEIKEKHEISRLLSHDAHGIGGSGIAASVIPDIDSLVFADQISPLNASKAISDQQTDQPQYDVHLSMLLPFLFRIYFFSSSLRSRMMNLIGVPTNPKV